MCWSIEDNKNDDIATNETIKTKCRVKVVYVKNNEGYMGQDNLL